MKETLQQMLIRHEGMKLKPYRCPAGKLTIGAGHNIEDNGISERAAMFILQEDIEDVMVELHENFKWFGELDTVRQDAIVDMVFNLGMPRFKQFKKTITAISKGDYIMAHDEMLNSKWAVQVGDRARELATMMLTGEARP